MRYVRQVCILLAVLASSGAFDTQVMNCQNACVVVGPTTGVANPAGNAPCNLNCTSQQLVCKQACTRPQQ